MWLLSMAEQFCQLVSGPYKHGGLRIVLSFEQLSLLDGGASLSTFLLIPR